LDQDLSIGTAISIIFGFLRWRFPTIPKHTAEAGIVAGGLLILADAMGPSMKPNILAAGLFLIGVLFIGGSLDVWLRPSTAKAQTPTEPPGSTVIENSGGGIGAEISAQGTPGSSVPIVGLETNGLHIKQSGPGTGMKVEVGGNGGSAIGVRSNGPVVLEAGPPPQPGK
jgi:hypothetical protein